MWIAQVEVNVLSQVRQCPVVFWHGENIKARLRLGPHRCTAHMFKLDFNLSVWQHHVAPRTKSKEPTQQLVL